METIGGPNLEKASLPDRHISWTIRIGDLLPGLRLTNGGIEMECFRGLVVFGMPAAIDDKYSVYVMINPGLRGALRADSFDPNRSPWALPPPHDFRGYDTRTKPVPMSSSVPSAFLIRVGPLNDKLWENTAWTP